MPRSWKAEQPYSRFRLAPWLLAFTRHCTQKAHDRGTLATLELGRDVHARFDELQATGVTFAMHSDGMRFVGMTRGAVEKELELLAPTTDYGYVIPSRVDDAAATREAEPLLSSAVAASAFVGGDRHLDPRELVAGLETWLQEHGVQVHRDRQALGFAVRGSSVTAVRPTSTTGCTRWTMSVSS